MDENEIRRKELKDLHKLVDEQIEKRQHRIALAQAQQNTTRQWDLVAAAVEQANIEYHKLQGTEAKKMKGRSKIEFKQETKEALEGVEKDAKSPEDATRLEVLRSIAGYHTLLGNKLNSIARRMKTNARNKGDRSTHEENDRLNASTLNTYQTYASRAASRKDLTDQQKQHMKSNWYRRRTDKAKNEEEAKEIQAKYAEQIESTQRAEQEIEDMRQQVQTCDIKNIIHVAKVARLAEAHIQKAKSYMAKMKEEVRKVKKGDELLDQGWSTDLLKDHR